MSDMWKNPWHTKYDPPRWEPLDWGVGEWALFTVFGLAVLGVLWVAL